MDASIVTRSDEVCESMDEALADSVSESMSGYDTPCEVSSCDHVDECLDEPLNEVECEYETDEQVAELLKEWSGRPSGRSDDHPWVLSCVERVVVPPGTITSVRVSLPN